MVEEARTTVKSAADIYGGRDPRFLAAYTVAETARYVRVPRGTLLRWLQPDVGLIVRDEPPYLVYNQAQLARRASR